MKADIAISNRQVRKNLDLRFLRSLLKAIIEADRPTTPDFITSIFQLGIQIVSSDEMAKLNEKFLSHSGPTDVITFDYHEPDALEAETFEIGELWMRGDIIICMDIAISQARRFKTSWPAEITRYLVHGFLHLRGYDDKKIAARRLMKTAENKLVRQLTEQFDLRRLDKARYTPKLTR